MPVTVKLKAATLPLPQPYRLKALSTCCSPFKFSSSLRSLLSLFCSNLAVPYHRTQNSSPPLLLFFSFSFLSVVFIPISHTSSTTVHLAENNFCALHTSAAAVSSRSSYRSLLSASTHIRAQAHAPLHQATH